MQPKGKIIGLRKNISQNSFWSILLSNCIRKQPIPIWGSGKTGRDVIYVKDAAIATLKAMEHIDATGIYNIGSGKITSNIDLARTYCEVFNNHAGVRYVDLENEKIVRICMNCNKAKSEMQFTTQYSLIDMVNDIKIECFNNGLLK